jgi:hypothetical protein
MGMLRIKPGVTLDRLAIAGARILLAVTEQAAKTDFDWLLTCATSGHPPADPHSRGEGEDFSLTPFPNSAAVNAGVLALRQALGPAYTVLLEFPEAPDDALLARIATVNPKATGPHIHVQIKKGTTTIPQGVPDDQLPPA